MGRGFPRKKAPASHQHGRTSCWVVFFLIPVSCHFPPPWFARCETRNRHHNHILFSAFFLRTAEGREEAGRSSTDLYSRPSSGTLAALAAGDFDTSLSSARALVAAARCSLLTPDHTLWTLGDSGSHRTARPARTRIPFKSTRIHKHHTHAQHGIINDGPQ